MFGAMPSAREMWKAFDDALERLVLHQELERLGIDKRIAKWLTDGDGTTMQDYGILSTTWADC